MEESEPIVAPAKKEEVSLIDKVLKIFAFPIAAVSGYWVMHTDVRNSSYDTAKRLGTFDDLLATHTHDAKENVAKRISGVIEREEFLAESSRLKNSYSKAVSTRLDHMGLGNFSAEWKHIGRSPKQEAVLKGLTVAGIAVGALLTIVDNKWLSDRFSSGKDQDKQAR